MRELKKLLRFMLIYGPLRALYKVAGRLRRGSARWLTPRLWPVPRDVAVLGCGQFAFATIGYVIATRLGLRFRRCYDPDARAMQTFERFYRLPLRSARPADVIEDPGVRLVYIASNHASHTPYALEALRAGKSVYIEKPVSVSREQLRALCEERLRSGLPVFAGYNRPFSAAIRQLRRDCAGVCGPLAVSYFISGHQIGPEHWYRRPEEGTRICGNVGHWLDLSVHLLCWRELADGWTIRLSPSRPDARDDNVVLTLVSDAGDLVNIVLVSHCEPFEGINESVDLQWGDVIAKIDDFRTMTVRRDDRLRRYRFWPKDVGHLRAILQPFGTPPRDWHEVELSTLLMLHITDMVRQGVSESRFSFSEAWQSLGIDGPATAAASHTSANT